MTYTVSFTDSTNPAKPPITVADGALNTQTSLTFPGQNYSGYGPVIAGNFLHLLENFADSTSPTNPVQGQLWFDTSTGNNILRVYDGTNWVEAGSLKKAPYASAPSPASSTAGDLWVDTTNSQLYLFSGSSWLLIGPVYSSGLQTGPVVESIIDTSNTSHPVTTLYSDGNRVAIFSGDANFTPKTSIDGFAVINRGINLYSNTLSGISSSVWGTAQSANSLIVSGSSVLSSNFLRSDITSTTNNPFNIRNVGGLSIGSDLSLNISQGSNVFTFYSKNSSNNIEFNVGGNIVLHIDLNGNIGIGKGNITPATALSVAGVITTGVAGTAGGLIVNDGTSPTPNTVLTVNPSTGISTSLNTTFANNITVAGQILISSSASPGAVILPPINSTAAEYDIGSQTQPFRNVYANSFVGDFTGSFTGTFNGNISGAAASLTSSTNFVLSGDIISSDTGTRFNGQTVNGEALLNTEVSPTMITGKPQATGATATDQILVYQSTISGSGLVSMTREVYLAGASAFIIPVGTIIPYAGSSTSIPNGWLMCDGSEISVTVYNELFLVLGYTYGAQNTLLGSNTFALPDIRGRFPLGLDNMNNYGNVPGFAQATNGASPPVNVNTGGQIGPAGRVTNVAADTLGGNSGSQNVVLTTTQLPQHTHAFSDPGHAHVFPGDDQLANAAGLDGWTGTEVGPFNYDASSSLSGSAHMYLTSTATTGASVGNVVSTSIGQAVTIMNPYLALNYIIFTGKV
jgi:microcystin-dependent protein